MRNHFCAFSEQVAFQPVKVLPDATGMADETTHASVPSSTLSVAPESYAQGLYARVLSQWTLDLLHACTHRLDVPSPRKGEGVAGIAFAPASSAGLPSMDDCERYLQWQPQRKAA